MMACSNSSDDELRNVPGDMFRRQVHNRVERRRKDKINSWIIQIGELLPDSKDPRKQSKNSILERAVEYIRQLKATNESLLLEKCTEVQVEEFQRMKKQIADLIQLNDGYAKLLRAAGIPLCSSPDDVWSHKPGKYSNKFTAEQGSALSQQLENGSVINGTQKGGCFQGISDKHATDSRLQSDNSDSSQNSEKPNAGHTPDLGDTDSTCQNATESGTRKADGNPSQVPPVLLGSNDARNGFSSSGTGESQDGSLSQQNASKDETQLGEGRGDVSADGVYQGPVSSTVGVFAGSGPTTTIVSQPVNVHSVGESTAVTRVLPSVPVMSSSQQASSIINDPTRLQTMPLLQPEMQFVSSDPSYLSSRRPGGDPTPQPILFINENGVPVLQSTSPQNTVTLIDPTSKTNALSALPSNTNEKQQLVISSPEQITGTKNITEGAPQGITLASMSSSCATVSNNSVSPQNSAVTTTVDTSGGVVRPVNGAVTAGGEQMTPSSASTANPQAVLPNTSSVVQGKPTSGARPSAVQSGCLVPLNGSYVTQPTINMHLPTASDTTMAQTSSFGQPMLQNNGVYVGQPVTLGQQGQIITLGGNAVFNAPGNVATQQHFPSALLLPNGQLIPVVTQPSMMYAAPSGGMNNSFVLTPTGRPQQGVPDMGMQSDFSLQTQKQGPVTITSNSSPGTLLIPQTTTMPSILPAQHQSVAFGTSQSLPTDGSTVVTSISNNPKIIQSGQIPYGNMPTSSSTIQRSTASASSSQSGNGSNPKSSSSKAQSRGAKTPKNDQGSKRPSKSKAKNSRSNSSKTPPSSQQVNAKGNEPEMQASDKLKTSQNESLPPPISDGQYTLMSYSSASVNNQNASTGASVTMDTCEGQENRTNACLTLEEECFESASKSFSGTTDILAKATESIFSSYNLEMSPPEMDSLDEHLEFSESQSVCSVPVNSAGNETSANKQKDEGPLGKDASHPDSSSHLDSASSNASIEQPPDLANLMNGSAQQHVETSQSMMYQSQSSLNSRTADNSMCTPSSMGSSVSDMHTISMQQKNKLSPDPEGEPSKKKAKKNTEPSDGVCELLMNVSSNAGSSLNCDDKSGQLMESDGKVGLDGSSGTNCSSVESGGTYAPSDAQGHKNFSNIEGHSTPSSLGSSFCPQQTPPCESVPNFSFPITEETSADKPTNHRTESSFNAGNESSANQTLQPLLRNLSDANEMPSPVNSSSSSSLPFLTLSPEGGFGTKDTMSISHRQNSYSSLSMSCTETTKSSTSPPSQKNATLPGARADAVKNALEVSRDSSESPHPSQMLMGSAAHSVASTMSMSPSYCSTSMPSYPIVPSPSVHVPQCKKSGSLEKPSELQSSKNLTTDKAPHKEITRSSSLHNLRPEMGAGSLAQKTSSQEVTHSPGLHFVSSTPPPMGGKTISSQGERTPPSPMSPNFTARSLPLLNMPKENSHYTMTGAPTQASPHQQPCISPFRYPPERGNLAQKPSQTHQQMLPSPGQLSIPPHSPGGRVSSASPHNIPSPGYGHRTTASQNSLSLSSYSAEALIGHHTPHPPVSTAVSSSSSVSHNSNPVLTPPHSSHGPSPLQSPYSSSSSSSVPSSPNPRISRAQISYSAESLIRSHTTSHEKVKDSTSSRVPASALPSAYITSSYHQCPQRPDQSSNSHVPSLGHTNATSNHCFPSRSENLQHCPSSVPSVSVPHSNQSGMRPNPLGNGHIPGSRHMNPTSGAANNTGGNGSNNFTTPPHQSMLHPPPFSSSSSRHQLAPPNIDHSSSCNQSGSSSASSGTTSTSLTSSYVNMTYSMESESSMSTSLTRHSRVGSGSEAMPPSTSLSSCLQNIPNASIRSSVAGGSSGQQHAGCFFTGHSSSSVHTNSLMQISDPGFSILSNQPTLTEQHRHDSALSRAPPPMFGNFSQPNAQPHLVNNLFPGHFIPNGTDVRNEAHITTGPTQRSSQASPMNNMHDGTKRLSSREQRGSSQLRSPGPTSTKLPSPNKGRSGSKKGKHALPQEETSSSSVYSESNRHLNSTNYFSVPELSTSRNDNSTCYSTRYLTTPQRSLGTSSPSNHSVQHKPTHMGAPSADISSNPPYNPLFRPQTQNGLNLNFQPTGFGMNLHQVPSTTSTAASVPIGTHVTSAPTHHMPNFNLSNIFPDINTSNESLGLSPVKFPPPPPNHILAPPHPTPPSVQGQSHSDPSALSHTSSHQNRGPQHLYPGRSHHPPVIHNSVSFNPILSHNPHTFDSRSPTQMAVGINNTMAPPPPPFGPTHGHTPSFGNVIPGLNFSAHGH